jgi:two-component system, NarL family, sensor histidine kinase FusK
MGVFVISPVLLIGSSMVRSLPLLFSMTKVLEVLVLIVALTVIGQIIFGDVVLAGPGHFQVSLSMFPFAIWSALRFGSIGVAGVTVIASLLPINGTVQGTGQFALHKEMDSLILWCLFADIMAIIGLLLEAVNSRRENALLALKGSNENLERQVQKRTDELRCCRHPKSARHR